MPSDQSIAVIFDTNIWVSFTIGKQLSSLKNVLLHPVLAVFTCQETMEEYLEVVRRPRIQKYITQERVENTVQLMESLTVIYPRQSIILPVSRDPKDNYLLQASMNLNARYLVSGDSDLLVLHPYRGTRILRYTDFLAELGELK
jgi:hypothetical protein